MGEKGGNSMVNSSRPSLGPQMELLDVDILSKHPHHTTTYKPLPDTADRQRCKALDTTLNVPSHTIPRKTIPKSASIREHKPQNVDLETPGTEPESRYSKAGGCWT
ncbi:uncharacterized protein EAE98_009222 [Botrytis deweyae]|uniref:Uncharacterized protein n=1 Tax=Botrytis deweyae TaxID=2478750 RepID=A0ABQ7ICH2_9HELO|nr:uncharacterized protein EAE98_009222 [Botrytis deweyae]KAF7919988.1 hypothetical protein EAE98_009222 [Botrytis deweyae]